MNKIFLNSNNNLKTAIKHLGKNKFQFLIITDKRKKLIGTITDGDIRRALIKGCNMKTSVTMVMNLKPKFSKKLINEKNYFEKIKKYKIKYLPIVDKNKRVIDLKYFDAFKSNKKISNEIIIMAGGKGKRLYPLTKNFPKPMLPIFGKPILQHIIEKARDIGFINFTLITNFSSEIIKKYFRKGKKFNVRINYINEKTFLGTAGGLGLIKKNLKNDFILLNGDALTNIPLLEMLKFHTRHNSLFTLASKPYDIKNPYGVITTRGFEVKSFEEKPTITSQINTGIYVINPKILKRIKKNKYLNMSDLITSLILNKKTKVLTFPVHENWDDAGNFNDFIKMSSRKN